MQDFFKTNYLNPYDPFQILTKNKAGNAHNDTTYLTGDLAHQHNNKPKTSDKLKYGTGLDIELDLSFAFKGLELCILGVMSCQARSAIARLTLPNMRQT